MHTNFQTFREISGNTHTHGYVDAMMAQPLQQFTQFDHQSFKPNLKPRLAMAQR